MIARHSMRLWLALSALVTILLFATVAAEAMLHGTRPPPTLTPAARLTSAGCVGEQACGERSATRTAHRSTAARCTMPRLDTI